MHFPLCARTVEDAGKMLFRGIIEVALMPDTVKHAVLGKGYTSAR